MRLQQERPREQYGSLKAGCLKHSYVKGSMAALSRFYNRATVVTGHLVEQQRRQKRNCVTARCCRNKQYLCQYGHRMIHFLLRTAALASSVIGTLEGIGLVFIHVST